MQTVEKTASAFDCVFPLYRFFRHKWRLLEPSTDCFASICLDLFVTLLYFYLYAGIGLAGEGELPDNGRFRTKSGSVFTLKRLLAWKALSRRDLIPPQRAPSVYKKFRECRISTQVGALKSLGLAGPFCRNSQQVTEEWSEWVLRRRI
jgi:hypothetical protein